jgi:2-isopropylmalate synthase
VSPKIDIYDVTLRDGAQGPGIKFSAEDQLRIVRELDAFGIQYIEGGQPGANPKAADLFRRIRDLGLKNSAVAAFGSTRHTKFAVEDDPNIKALVEAGTPVVTIFAKTSPSHVREILRTTLENNLEIIYESVTYLRAAGRRVFLDAEHFYDGYREDSEYALAALERAVAAGAESLILCDTNGGRLPHEIDVITRAAITRFPDASFGIHVHNDSGCAVANSLMAVCAGATQVQGTINGYGERTGNADLCTIIPNLQLKMGYDIVSSEQLNRLTYLSHLVAELANMAPRDSAPYVGRDAYTHKAGMHADAVRKSKTSYEHIDPTLVGNRTRVTVSEMSGRSSLVQKAREMGVALDGDTPDAKRILEQIKQLENNGYEFEGADASLELLMLRLKGQSREFFKLDGFHVTVIQQPCAPSAVAVATVLVTLPDNTSHHTVAEGNGPVDALNNALRKALEHMYPELRNMRLDDYKVRIIDARSATRAKTRVLLGSCDLEDSWSTVGVSENILSASYEALADSIAFKLMRTRGQNPDAVQ